MGRIATILLVILSLNLFAQNAQLRADIDRISYEQFQNKQLKELKETVKNAVASNIDFYYLRLRAGILAYDNKKYEYAIAQFKKALTFFPSDTLSKEYLYYAYLFTNRKEAAGDFASKQNITFQKKVNYKKKPFAFIGVDGGVILNNNIQSNKDNTFKTGTELGKAERTLNGNLYFGEVSFQNTIKNRWHINNAFSAFNTASLYQINILLPNRIAVSEQEFNNLNFQYNLGMSYVTKKDWTIGVGFGYYRVKGNTFTALQPDTINNRIPILTDTTIINSFLGSITVGKRFKNVQPYMQISVANLNALTQVQAELGLTYYPLGNYNLYGTTSGTFLKNDTNNQFIIGQKIGFKILNWWWSEFNFNYGNLSNFITANGFATYNTSDAIKLQTGMDFNFYIKKHFQLDINYTFQQRERTTQQYNKSLGGIVVASEKANYFNHLIKTSLLWNF